MLLVSTALFSINCRIGRAAWRWLDMSLMWEVVNWDQVALAGL